MRFSQLFKLLPWKRDRSQRGATLIEIIIATGIVGLVMTSAVSAMTVSLRATSIAKNKNMATKYTQEGLEYFRTQRSLLGWESFVDQIQASNEYCLATLPGIQDGGLASLPDRPCTAQETIDDNGRFQRSAEVYYNTEGDENIFTITVNVTWDEGNRPLSSNATVELRNPIAATFDEPQFIPIPTPVIPSPVPTPAPEGWLYRVPLAISNGTGSTQTDYPVLARLDTTALIAAGKMNADCSDLRFTAADEVTELPFWIQTGVNPCPANNTTFFVKVPSIPTSGTTIYAYYGKPDATSVQNGSATFDFFDDFSAGTLSTDKWLSTGAYSINNGEITITTGSIFSKNPAAVSTEGRLFEMRAKWGPTVHYSGLSLSNSQSIAGNNGDFNKVAMFMSNSNLSIAQHAFGANGQSIGYNIVSNAPLFTPDVDSFVFTGVGYSPTALNFYAWRGAVGSYANLVQYPPYLILGFFTGSTAGTTDMTDLTVDFVIGRKYAVPEPGYTVGSEEDGNWQLSSTPFPDSPPAAVIPVPATNWQYRTPLAVTNSTGETKTDYQVLAYLNTSALISAGKMKADCSDLRMTDANGNQVPFWIQESINSCNNTSTAIFARIPSIPTTGTTIYAYYGRDTTIASASNGVTTFDFFDDFSAPTLNTSKWAATGAYSINSGVLTISTGSLYTTSTVASTTLDRLFEMRAAWSATAENYAGIHTSNANSIGDSNANSNRLAMFMSNSSANIAQTAWGANGSAAGYNVVSNVVQYTPAAATYYFSGFGYNASTLRFFANRIQSGSYANAVQYSPFMFLGYFRGSASAGANGTNMSVDFALVRKLGIPELTTTVGSEQTSSWTTPGIDPSPLPSPSPAAEPPLPSGAVVAFTGGSCPSGWAAFSTGYGRSIIGTNPSAGGGISARSLLDTGGAQTHTLTIAQLPSHNHAGTTADPAGVANALYNTFTGMTGGGWGGLTNTTGLRWGQGGLVPNGSDVPHNNMPPFVVGFYCVKQ